MADRFGISTKSLYMWMAQFSKLNFSSVLLFFLFALLNVAMLVLSGAPDDETVWILAVAFYFGTLCSTDLIARFFTQSDTVPPRVTSEIGLPLAHSGLFRSLDIPRPAD